MMSAYYTNLLPPSFGTGTTVSSQDPYSNQESKFDAAFYNSASAAQGLAYEADNQHPALPRFPPFDRLDIRPIGSKHGFTPTTTSYQNSALSGYQLHQNGQFPEDGSAGCKVPPDSAIGLSGTANSQNTPSMVSHFNSGSFGGVALSSVHTQNQNLPIYPWMRPINGGKSRLCLHTLYLSSHVLFYWLKMT